MRLNRWRCSDEFWAFVEPLLPVHANKDPLGRGRHRRNDRDAMDAILFVARTGCQWNALNATGICSSSTAHRRFQEWAQAGVFLKLWQDGLEVYDELKGLNWSWQSMDGAMTKAPLGGGKTGSNPTDRGKSHTKRSLLTEADGIPVGLAIAGANVNDFKLARQTIESIPIRRPPPSRHRPQHLCLDKGYDYDEVRDLAVEFGFTAHIRSRGEEAKLIRHSSRFKARRWVAERTHSWMNRYRRILIRWEKKPENHTGMLHLTLGCITYQASGLFLR